MIKKNLIKISALLFLVFFIWCLIVIRKRILWERDYRVFFSGVEFSQIKVLAFYNNYSLNRILEILKNAGINTIIFPERNFKELFSTNQIKLYTPQEYKTFLPNPLLKKLQDLNIIVSENFQLASYLKNIIETSLNVSVNVDRYKDLFLLSSDAFDEEKIELLNNLTIGYLSTDLNLVKYYNFKTAFIISEKLLPYYNTNFIEISGIKKFDFFIILDDTSYIYDSLKNLIKNILTPDKKFLYFEFLKQKKIRKILTDLPKNVIKAHTIPLDELANYTDISSITNRYLKALRERNCRFFFFNLNYDQPIDIQIANLKNIITKFYHFGFRPSGQLPEIFTTKFTNFKTFIAMIIMMIGPLISTFFTLHLLEYLKFSKYFIPVIGLLLLSLFTFIISLIVSSLLTSPEYIFSLKNIHGIKLGILIPCIFLPFIIFNSSQRREVFLSNITWIGMLGYSLIIILFLIIFLKSANYGLLFPFETKFRTILENIFFVRPRFKEFLFGHPSIMLGLWIYSRENIKLKHYDFPLSSKLLIWFGIIGQISIINTFIHIHTSLITSISRAFTGLFLGIIVGIIYISVFELIKLILQSPPFYGRRSYHRHFRLYRIR